MSFSVRPPGEKTAFQAVRKGRFTLKLMVTVGLERGFHGRHMVFTRKLTRFGPVGVSLIVNHFGSVA